MQEEKKPLDMTTDEAIEFLFPKEAIDELKRVANPANIMADEALSDSDCNDDSSAYKNGSS